jgi:hypothetical protein
MGRRGKTGQATSGIVRRKDLKPRPAPSDEALLKSARAAATRAQNAADWQARAAVADREARTAEL